MPCLSVGEEAPGFTLAGTGGSTYTLAEQRGAAMVLVFYPGDDTPVCTQQLRAYSCDLAEFQGAGATIWAISPQDLASHERFSARRDLRIPLLADTDRTVGRSYGVMGPVGFYRRSVFVLDGDGIVRYAHRALAGLTFRPITELVRAVRSIQVAN